MGRYKNTGGGQKSYIAVEQHWNGPVVQRRGKVTDFYPSAAARGLSFTFVDIGVLRVISRKVNIMLSSERRG